jgi:hypothetical protein
MSFWSSLKFRLVLAGALIMAVAAVIFSIRRGAYNAGSAEEKIKGLEQVLKNVIIKDEVAREVERMPVDDVARRLRDKWSRD